MARAHHDPRQMDIVTQAPWVAGQVATQLPNTGSASFSGAMYGQAQNAGGPIRNVGGSYGTELQLAVGRRQLPRVVRQPELRRCGGRHGRRQLRRRLRSGGNRIGNLAGAFNTSPGRGWRGRGPSGTFGIAGPGYVASGVFAGAKQ